jgi:hypothetical protein
MVPPEALGQTNFLHRREVLSRLLEGGRGKLLLARCPRLAAEIASRRRPGLAGHHLFLAAALGQAGREGEARRLLFLGLRGRRRRPVWVPPRLVEWALPAEGEGLLRVLATCDRREGELGRSGLLRLLPPLALALEKAGAGAEADRAWGRLLEVCGEEDASERERIGLYALERRCFDRARGVLRPLALAGKLSPGEAARILAFLLAREEGAAELEAALLAHLRAFPRRDLALLAAARLRGGAARKAVAAVLAERPGDGELEKALERMGAER